MFPILWGLLQSIVFTVFSNAGGVGLSRFFCAACSAQCFDGVKFVQQHFQLGPIPSQLISGVAGLQGFNYGDFFNSKGMHKFINQQR